MVNTTVRLSEMCDLVTEPVKPGQRPDALYLGLEHLAPGRLRPIGGGRASEMRSNMSAFQPDDVLYGKLRPYLDKAVLASQFGVCTTELLVLRPRSNIDPRFLTGILHSPSFLEYAIAGTTGVQHPRTSWTHIRECDLPAFRFDEQQLLASLFWLINDAIEGSEKKRATLDGLLKALLHQIMTSDTWVNELDLSGLFARPAVDGLPAHSTGMPV